MTLWHHSEVLLGCGRANEALVNAEAGLALGRRLDHRGSMATTLLAVGIAHAALDDTAGAIAAFEESMRISGEDLVMFGAGETRGWRWYCSARIGSTKPRPRSTRPSRWVRTWLGTKPALRSAAWRCSAATPTRAPSSTRCSRCGQGQACRHGGSSHGVAGTQHLTRLASDRYGKDLQHAIRAVLRSASILTLCSARSAASLSVQRATGRQARGRSSLADKTRLVGLADLETQSDQAGAVPSTWAAWPSGSASNHRATAESRASSVSSPWTRSRASPPSG